MRSAHDQNLVAGLDAVFFSRLGGNHDLAALADRCRAEKIVFQAKLFVIRFASWTSYPPKMKTV